MKIDGRNIATEIYEDLKTRVGELQKKSITPHLAIIIVGEDPASIAYVNQKQKWGDYIGAKITVLKYPISVTTSELETKIKKLNNDSKTHAILIQRPLPPQIDTKKLELLVNPHKDIDAFHPNSPYTPPIAQAVIKILKKVYKVKEVSNPEFTKATLPSNFKHQNLTSNFKTSQHLPQFLSWLKNQEIVILGKGHAGGKPVFDHFQKLGLNSTLIDSKTPNPEKLIKQAAIIISAVGKPNILTSDKIKKDAIVIGIGISRTDEGKLRGDFDEESIDKKARFYTPTPGGIGPINVAMLLYNLVTAAKTIHDAKF